MEKLVSKNQFQINYASHLKKYSENENLASPGLGRPFVSDRGKVFQQMIEYLRANVEEQITLNDLKELTDSFARGIER